MTRLGPQAENQRFRLPCRPEGSVEPSPKTCLPAKLTIAGNLSVRYRKVSGEIADGLRPGADTALFCLRMRIGHCRPQVHAPVPFTLQGLTMLRRSIGVVTWCAAPHAQQVICRCAHVPEDELVQVSHSPIPERWLSRTIGYEGDGSVADLLAEVIATWPT